MARKTRLVLNCVGPYRFFGEVVVKACVENGTHHVDISGRNILSVYSVEFLPRHDFLFHFSYAIIDSTFNEGEPQYLETMQLKYNTQAEENGVYVVGSCGFDSIPADLGSVVVHRAMEGPVNKVTFIQFSGISFFKINSMHLYFFGKLTDLESAGQGLDPQSSSRRGDLFNKN